MTFKPAHKQDEEAKKPAQLHFDKHPYLKHNNTDMTLADYIRRKEQYSFDVWWEKRYFEETPCSKEDAREIWNVAQALK